MQPVPASSRNSELGVYVVQYRQAGDPAWAELSTEDNQTLSITIRWVIVVINNYNDDNSYDNDMIIVCR